MNHRPRKRFGQHFLHDRSVIEAIVEAISPCAGERVVEIGPGLGALTDAVLARVPVIDAVELDRDLVAKLRARYPSERLRLHADDALRFDFGALGPDLRLIGNLPYNISSPLLVRTLDFHPRIRDMHFMLQREVVDRIVARPGQPDYGRLGVLLQAFFDCESVFDVAPQAFTPPPRVWSAVVRMNRREPAVRDAGALSALLAAAFSQRRKMLRGTLVPWLAQRGIPAEGLDPTARPENVEPERYYALAERLAASGRG
ncbi:MAG: 16S rRNA (adenine(1518)-N(6)/adenine(1519)-N(6))-dimethyltransferase RsmA [Burkholderiaceae bacterium]|nr:16S rRNA (adenine(1518)-N(6)/adenine(1519)-N(6))-dimethyltransferase RsmA [Burkholderiaceae bacterium]